MTDDQLKTRFRTLRAEQTARMPAISAPALAVERKVASGGGPTRFHPGLRAMGFCTGGLAALVLTALYLLPDRPPEPQHPLGQSLPALLEKNNTPLFAGLEEGGYPSDFLMPEHLRISLP